MTPDRDVVDPWDHDAEAAAVGDEWQEDRREDHYIRRHLLGQPGEHDLDEDRTR